MFIRLKDHNEFSIKDLENKALQSLLHIYHTIRTLLKDSNVLDIDFELNRDKLGSILKSVIRLPDTFLTLQKNPKIEVIKKIISEI
jgi:hypothetical protein